NLKHDTVLLTNSDAITNLNYENFFLHFTEHEADMSVAAIPYSFSVPYGIFELDGRNIRGVLEKPTYNYYANAGIYLIKRDLLSLIPEGEFFNATDFIERLINQGKRVIRYPLTGYWLDIGVPDEYARAKEYINHINN
ncbi:MAG: nucleotidyltransferase, partial [Muribaculaceae bacterium]|nr:nucleotidyltransferase [Muribaculaceae bacterium]